MNTFTFNQWKEPVIQAEFIVQKYKFGSIYGGRKTIQLAT